ncbi:MAG: TlpA family protein disulfide reductase [Gammaproteobacteria bacterium]|nr:TlpA family protein disulfide reductase [Gammaproteobacteria bacterium]
MSNQSKILLISVAVVAFIVGLGINKAVLSDEIKIEELLNAKLMTSEGESKIVKSNLGDLTLINFWATWCTPCRREMPLFETFYQNNKANGFQIIGIAIDNQANAQPMLDSMGITYPILYAEQTGIKLMELSGNQSGGMPYSILVDKKGTVIDLKLGQVHEPQLNDWVKGARYEGDQ